MRDVLATVSKIIFYLLAGAVFLWTASLTVSLVSRLLPGDAVTPFFALALFDGGALAWALTFMFSAQGLPQRAVALLAMAADLLGVIVVAIAELFLGGQDLAIIPVGLGNLVVWGVGIFTALNLVALYGYHLGDPAELQEIKLRSLQDRVQAEALRQVEQQVRVEAQELAGQIAAGIRADVLARLHLLPANTIDATATDVPDPTPAGNRKPR